MNGEIVVVEKFLLALAVDVDGPPLFSGPSDHNVFYCPVDRSIWRDLVKTAVISAKVLKTYPWH